MTEDLGASYNISMDGYQKIVLNSIIRATKANLITWLVLPLEGDRFYFCEFKRYGILVKFIHGDKVSVKVYCGRFRNVLTEFEDEVKYGSGPYCAIGHELMHAILNNAGNENDYIDQKPRDLNKFIRDIKDKMKSLESDGPVG